MHNKDQLQFWNGPGGQKWVIDNDFMEGMLHDIGILAIDALAPEAGDKVLDIGCGCGNQTLDLARRVGRKGEVVGVDISAPMLQLGRQIAAAAAHEAIAAVTFLEADAYDHDFRDGHFDLLFSRFGVMFFDDPVGAFSNLRGALKPNGRLGFVCWQAPEKNAFMTIPVREALKYLPAPEPQPAGAPGPFAFASSDRIRSILADSGFNSVAITATTQALQFGAGKSFELACREILNVGPVSRLLGDADEALKQLVFDAVCKVLKPFYKPKLGLCFEGNFWVVTAVNSAEQAS